MARVLGALKRAAGLLLAVMPFAALGLAVLALVPVLLGMHAYSITSGSMEPAIPTGALVYDELVPASEIAVGDVITYQPPPEEHHEQLVTHRVVRVDEDSKGERVYQTKGDANAKPDPWRFKLLTDDQPRYRFHVPLAGYVFAFLSLESGWMLLIVLPAGLVILSALIWIIRTARQPVDDGSPAMRAAGTTAAVAVLALAFASTAGARFESTVDTTLKAAAESPTAFLRLLSDEADSGVGSLSGYANRNGTGGNERAAKGADETLKVNFGGSWQSTQGRDVQNVFSIKVASPLPSGVSFVRVNVSATADPATGYSPLSNVTIDPLASGASSGSTVNLTAGQRAWVDVRLRTFGGGFNRQLLPKIRVRVAEELESSWLLDYNVPASVYTGTGKGPELP